VAGGGGPAAGKPLELALRVKKWAIKPVCFSHLLPRKSIITLMSIVQCDMLSPHVVPFLHLHVVLSAADGSETTDEVSDPKVSTPYEDT
jgi:hypothetical protein